MGRVSDDVANALLDLLFGAGSNTVAPATYYVALSLTLPANDGTNVTEPTTGAYARVAVTNDVTSWPAAAARSKSNGVTITWPTATDTWGEISHYALFDADTAGVMKGWGALDTPITVAAGGTPSFPINSIFIDAPGG